MEELLFTFVTYQGKFVSVLPSTFDEIFLSHYDRIFRMLVRIVGASAEAEELAQETFLRLHRHFEDIEVDRVHHWLHRVGSNLGLNALRGRKRWHAWRHKAIELHEILNTGTAHDPIVATTVRRVLSEIPDRHAQLLLLHAEGWSYEEIAETLQVKRSSISQLLSRARKSFEQTYDTLHHSENNSGDKV